MEKSCWYKAVVGVEPDESVCDGFNPVKCEGCLFFLSEPPERTYSIREVCDIAGITAEDLENSPVPDID